jgi:hypothetical protein
MLKAFESQTSESYDGQRVARLRDAWDAALEAVPASGDLRLGALDCRGRLCAMTVSFRDDAQAEAMVEAARTAAQKADPQSAAPGVHFVTLPQDPDGTTSGTLVFEWFE